MIKNDFQAKAPRVNAYKHTII